MNEGFLDINEGGGLAVTHGSGCGISDDWPKMDRLLGLATHAGEGAGL